MLNKYIGTRGLICLLCLLCSGFFFTSCQKDEEGSNGTTNLESFGPSPVLRGGEIKFYGTGLDKVTSIILPGDVAVSSFVTKTPELIVIQVPEETVEGTIVLKAPQGDIVTKTELGISEPISISSISPGKVRPGEVLTISGEYLNLISEIIFSDNKSVADFESHSRTKIEVIVPADARSGKIVLSNGEEEPILIESESELEVSLPVATEITPSTIKAGSKLTIKGTDLDLATGVIFGGDKSVSTFISKTASIIEVTVPADARDGKLKLVAQSNAYTESSDALTLSLPTVSSVSPNPGKTSGIITVTGTDLDLVSSVTFAGPVDGEIQSGGTATAIKVKVPATAKVGKVQFNTQAWKSVSSMQDLNLVVPTISSISPTSVNTADNPVITITGTDLDVVDTIYFGGQGWKAKIGDAVSVTPSEIKVAVTPGSLSGKIKIVTTNGNQVISSETLTIVPNIPNIPSMPSAAFIGGYMTITGTNLNVASEVIFPGGIKATSIAEKTATSLTVLVPANVAAGAGKVKFVTNKSEVYESPSVIFKFPGTEPVQSAALIINGFDESGHDLTWDAWDGLVELGNDPAVAISGKYLHGKVANASGWKWFWGCNHDGLEKRSVTTSEHVLKMDVKITKAIPGSVNFQMKLADVDIDLGNLGGSTPAGGWVTITYDLSNFNNLPNTIPTTGTWGMILQNGTADLTGLYIDNIRFHKK